MIGDSELVVKKLKIQCQTKHPRLRAYRNEVWYLVENFFLAFNVQILEGNQMDGSLAITGTNFKPLQNPLLRYEFKIRYKPSIPDNVRHWQVFEYDE